MALALTAFGAQNIAAPPIVPPPASTKDDTREIEITFEDWSHNEKTGLSEYKKAVIVDGDTTINSDTAQINRKTKTAFVTGNLRISDPQADVTGEKADVSYAKSKRLAVMTGKVHIILKPKSQKAEVAPATIKVDNGKAVVDGEADDANSATVTRKQPAEVDCDKVEYEYAKAKKHALLTGSFKVTQKLSDRTRTLTAVKAEWFGNEERLVLTAPVHMEDTKGTKADSNHDVTLYTKEGEERLKMGPGKMTVPVEDEDQASPAPGANAPVSPVAGGKPAVGDKSKPIAPK